MANNGLREACAEILIELAHREFTDYNDRRGSRLYRGASTLRHAERLEYGDPVPACSPAEELAEAEERADDAEAELDELRNELPGGRRVTTPADFMAAAPPALNGNSPWASRYAGELRQVVHEHARNSSRNLQVHLGPSEIGSPCDRQVVGKLAGVPVTNHVVDPWASVVGTAVHAWLADAFAADNVRHGIRWVPEQRVVPHPDHSGTADLYDAVEEAVVDHKILGESSMAKIRPPGDPPLRYVVQLLLYGKGYRVLGLPVRRVALAAYPRTSHTLDGLYVWERLARDDDDQLIDEVFRLTWQRKLLAQEVKNGRPLSTIPKTPSDDECFFCPFYRPQSAKDDGPGCPGNRS